MMPWLLLAALASPGAGQPEATGELFPSTGTAVRVDSLSDNPGGVDLERDAAADPGGEIEGEWEHRGLLGIGLGIEFPYVGITGGFGTQSDVGAGYCLGGALSYEITPEVLVRVFGTWDATQRGQGAVAYSVFGKRTVSKQRAEWLDFALGVGAAYQLRSLHPSFAPYLGADLAVTFIDGFEYRFAGELEDLTVDKEQVTQFDAGRLFGQSIGIMANVRLGVRLHLSEWLATLLEIDLSYLRSGEEQIYNTLNGPDVRSLSENIWLLSGRFAVRLGL